jgi:hypothetical protein
MSERVNAFLARAAADRFFELDAGEGLGGLHLMRALTRHGLGLEDWAQLGGDEIEARLRAALSRDNPGLAPEPLRARVGRTRRALAEAIYRQAEQRTRAQASALMRRAARDLRAVAEDEHRSLGLLARVLSRPTRAARQAGLEALGLGQRTAEGLEIRVCNPGRERLLAQIQSGRAALPGRGPLGVGEVQAALRSTAAGLERLAHALERERGVDVFERCPALARGLVAGLGPQSLLAETIAERLDFHRRCQRADQAALALGGLLLDLGAILSGGALAAASVLYDLGVAAGGLQASGRRRQEAHLGHLAGVLGEADLQRAGAETDRARGQALWTLAASSLPLSTGVPLGLERLPRERAP